MLKQAIEIHACDAALRRQLAKIWIQCGEYEAAEEQLKRAVQLEITADALNLLGIIQGSRGELKQAIEYFQAALKVDSQYVPAADNLQKARAALQQEP